MINNSKSMKRGRKIQSQHLFRAAALIWMAVIFSFSAQDGGHSGALSSAIAHWLMAELPGGERLPARMAALVIRKGAHMAEYAILAVLLFNSFGFKTPSMRRLWGSAAIAVAYAATDEAHQLLVAGRAGQWMDVAIDSVGMMAGLALCWHICRWRGRRSRRTQGQYQPGTNAADRDFFLKDRQIVI